MYNNNNSENKQLNRLILASQSPRRQAMLANVAREVVLLPQDVAEVTTEVEPHKIVMSLSVLKLGVLPTLYPDIPVVSGDTIVWMDGKQYGKPINRDNAIAMLSELVGRWHAVYTGYAIAYRGVTHVDWDSARVKFKELSLSEIEHYIDTHKPYDKAGSYGLQDEQVVEQYEGEQDTIIGFPYNKFKAKLSSITE